MLKQGRRGGKHDEDKKICMYNHLSGTIDDRLSGHAGSGYCGQQE